MLTTAEAALELGITARRVRVLITTGRLKATKFGRDWAIWPVDLNAVRDRPPGRPRKTA